MNVALIGCGKWGRYILRDLKTLGCRVSVVARSADSLARAREGDAYKIYPTVDELVHSEDLSGVVIATSTSSHAEVIKAVADGAPGAVIFVEKPAVCSSHVARLLHQEYPNRIFVMDKWRYHPGILKLAEIVASRSLGKVFGVRTERLGWGVPHNDLNAVWHLFPHDLAIIYEILGTIPSLKSSQVQKSFGEVFGVVASFGDDPWVSCSLSSHAPERRRRVQVVCEKGIAVLDDGYSTSVQIVRGPMFSGDITPVVEKHEFSSEMPLFAELQAFIKYVKGEGSPPKTPLVESIPMIEAIEAVLKNKIS